MENGHKCFWKVLETCIKRSWKVMENHFQCSVRTPIHYHRFQPINRVFSFVEQSAIHSQFLRLGRALMLRDLACAGWLAWHEL